MGGAEQHSRELAQHLSRYCDMQVVHVRTNEAAETDVSYAWNEAEQYSDGAVNCQQISAPKLYKPLLRGLSRQQKPGSRLARGLFAQTARQALSKQLRQLTQNSDVVHVIYNGFTPLAQAAADLDKPFVFTPLAHTTLPAGTGWSSAGFQALYRQADALVAMTEYEKQWLSEQGGDAQHTHVIPMAPLLENKETLSVESFRRQHELGSQPYILFLGRMNEAKGLHQLLRAMPLVWAQNPQLSLVLAGPQSEALPTDLQSILDDPRILNCGLLSGADKLAALKGCHALCVPSREESLGVIYLEAWTQARPVIAARTPVMQTVIKDGQDGILSRVEPEDLAAAILRLLKHPQLAESMGQEGFRKVTQQYSWADSAQRLAELYRALQSP